MSDVVVIGSGFGGLMAAIRLRAAGRDVVVLERNESFGGKVATYERDGFTFDLGPSLLTLPRYIDDTLRLAGTSLSDEIDLVRLTQPFRYFWPDHSAVAFHDDPLATAEAIEAMSPGAGAQYLGFVKKARRIWEISERTFLAGEMRGRLGLLRRMRSPRDFLDIDAMRTLSDAAAKTFDDPRLRQWAGRYATYSGSSPYEAPATLACIAAVEADHGSWYVTGGIGALRDAVVAVARRIGVQLRIGVEVSSIVTRRRRAVGVVTTAGEHIDARVVVANVDAEHLYGDLLPQPKQVERVRKAGRSTSGIVVLVGVEGTTPLVAHHNVWFSRDYAREFADLAAGLVPADPTVYAGVSSVTDSSQAPAGCENWFLLVNAPADANVDTDTYGDRLLDHLASVGPDLRARARFVETIGPRDIAARYRAPGGAIYGTSSNGRSAAFRRPTNTSVVRGVYLVGGSSHPGGGLPMVTASARIATELILRRRRDR